MRALPGHYARRALQYAHDELVVREPTRVFEGFKAEVKILEYIPGEALAATPDRNSPGVENLLYNPYTPTLLPLV